MTKFKEETKIYGKKALVMFLLVQLVFGTFLVIGISNTNSSLEIIQNQPANIQMQASDTAGVQEWNRTWGGVNVDDAYDVAIDSQNNVYVVGSHVFNIKSNATLIKYDPTGNEIWNRTWGGAEDDFAFGIGIDSTDFIYITGRTSSFGIKAFLAKYDSNGALIWNKTWPTTGTGTGTGTSIAIYNTNIYVAGHNGTMSQTPFLVKYDSAGTQHWFRSLTPYSYMVIDERESAVVDSTGNIYISGGFPNSTNQGDIFLWKFDSSGNIVWRTYWNSPTMDWGYDIAVDSTDNLYVAGYTPDATSSRDTLLIKYNSNGQQLWNTTWGKVSQEEEARGVAIDGNLIYLVGKTEPVNIDALLVAYDSNGQQLWNLTWGGAYADVAWGVKMDKGHNLYMVGITKSFGSGSPPENIFTVKYKLSVPPGPSIAGFQWLMAILPLALIIIVLLIRTKIRYKNQVIEL